jgi:hypothetical protein
VALGRRLRIPTRPRVGRQETETDNGGDLRHTRSRSSSNASRAAPAGAPLGVVGDGQAHPAPDGSGSYYFPD